MTDCTAEAWEDDEMSRWSDPSEYGPNAPSGKGFWGGVESREEDGPVRGRWIRSLRGAAKRHAPDADADVWDRMVMWLVEAGDRGGYIYLVTDDSYRSSQGGAAWRLNTAHLERDLPEAFAWAAAASGATQTIDEVLAAPLAFVKVAQPEPCGVDLLRERGGGEAAIHRFYQARNAVRNHWPRACATCGSQFRPARRGGINCAECLEKRRAERDALTLRRGKDA